MPDRIVIDATICHGKPVIRGTRTPVTVVLDALAGGDTFETIQNDYAITADDIRACIAFASCEGWRPRSGPSRASGCSIATGCERRSIKKRIAV